MIPIAKESVVKIKLGALIKKVGKTTKLIFKPPLIILFFIIKIIFKLWNQFFFLIYTNRKYLTKIYLKLIVITNLIFIILILLKYYGYNNHFSSNIILSCNLGYMSVFLLLYIYYIVIGKDNVLKHYIMMTDKYVEELLPPIIKIYGPPRVGKDTTGISFTSILARRNRRIIPIAMKKIRKICYIFDYELVNNVCNIHYRKFLSSSKTTRADNFLRLCNDHHLKCFIKTRYLTKINYQELILDYQEFLKNRVTFESEYVYNDGISKKHFLELLNEYMFLYVRLYIIKNFTLLNQPYIEEPSIGLMGKIYSVYYEAVSTPPPKQFIIEEDGIKVKILAKEKIENPIIDWTIINLSENDTWDNNLDPKVAKFIKEHHRREWKAYYGHGYDMLTYIQICHDASRMNKQLRELDAFYINILQRQEYLGAGKRVMCLSFIQSITNYFVEKGSIKLDDANNAIIYKKANKIKYYSRLYNATGNDKYLAMIKDIQDKEMKKPSKLSDLLSKINSKLLERIEILKRKYGTIRITATISDQPTAPNLKEATLKQLLNRETPLYHEAYRVDFYFRMTDSMGRYNHKYMSDVLESRARMSTKSFFDIEEWDQSMVLSKEAMLQMGYPSGLELYGITDQEVHAKWYEKVK